MDIKTYKANLKQQLSDTSETGYESAPELVGNAKERAAAIESAQPDLEDIGPYVENNLKVAATKSEAVMVRMAAIRALKSANFLGPKFDPYVSDYHDVLREIANDRSPTLRKTALRTLAVAKDSFAFDVLLKGLRGEIEPLVSEDEAIQYLSYDNHTGASAIVRDMYDGLTHRGKENALRMMASDKKAEALLSRVMTDESEKSSLRRLGAAGLKALNPKSFKDEAEKIITKDSDFDEIKALCVTALTNNLKAGNEMVDDGVIEKVKGIKTKSRNLKSAVKRFVDRV